MEPESETACAICKDELDSETTHTLPECNHNFHANCLIQWFRNGQDTCPLCRKIPNLTMFTRSNPSSYQAVKEYSKQKSASKEIKAHVRKVETLMVKFTEAKKVKSDFLKNKSFKEKLAKFNKCRRDLWRRKWTLLNLKAQTLNNFGVIPMIIVKKVNV